MIVVVGGIKGGCGKTTIATNLVVLRSQVIDNKKVLFVDADEQNSSSDWADVRLSLGRPTNWSTVKLSGKTIDSQLSKLTHDYDDIIVDVGGRDTTTQRSALLVADAFLVPFKPRSLDIWTLGKLKLLIFEVKIINPKLKCFAVINEADPSGSDNEEARKILSECEYLTCLECSIGRRKSFANAASDGISVTEMNIHDKKAVSEIYNVYGLLYR
jgi:chromosome partitioning protein